MTEPITVELGKGGRWWTETAPTRGEAQELAETWVDDREADEAQLDDWFYTRSRGWFDVKDCIACDGYVLRPADAPHCPTCARLLREGKTL